MDICEVLAYQMSITPRYTKTTTGASLKKKARYS